MTETSPAATENVNAVSETSIPVVNENAAFAAAAAAGSGMSESVMYGESSPTVEGSSAEASVVASAAAAPVEADPGRESELAAAWQNWKQIRESIVGSSPAKRVAETPAVQSSAAVETTTPGFKEIRREEPAAIKPEEDTASEGSGEEISSIVDTMLAELKPKLMEEISKKMGKSKRKK